MMISIGSKSLYCKYSTGKNGLHTFYNNSAESEPIWMRFGTVSAKCGGLALADFGCDLRSSDSLRGGRFFPKSAHKICRYCDFRPS